MSRKTKIRSRKGKRGKPEKRDFYDLVDIMRKLRSPQGCPWDREQTHSSIRESLLEEAYELIDAINENNRDHIVEELGDLLLHVVFHAEIGRGEGQFEIADVIESICAKLIRRHPHVFGNVRADNAGEVVRNWELIKAKEKAGLERKNLMDRVPRSQPAILSAKKILDIAYKEGFRWRDRRDLGRKLHEEVDEFLEDIRKGRKNAELEDEFGDILFVLVNIARENGIDPESALRKANRKFVLRFNHIENSLRKEGKRIRQTSFEKLLKMWQLAKRQYQ
jgi:tetrapyrrole methylase family protein/MazG family protein